MARPNGSLRRGSRLGKYRLDRKLGKGGFSTVWKARDTVENRNVAVKIASPELVEEHGRKALEHEARVASRLSHPNVVGVRNADWMAGYFVIITDLAVKSLAASPGIRRSGSAALRVLRDAASGLAYAHSQNVLHRDVKPENILLFEDGRAAICDFGVSRFAKGPTRTYTEAGTLGYMAPEQAYGKPRFASDVFSLGLIAYELLTGVLPTWPFEWPPEGHRRFLERVPEVVRPVLRKAAAFEPRDRYEDALEFDRALELAFDKVEESTRPRPRRRKPKRPAPSPLTVESEHFRRQHGAALAMRYECYRCEGVVAESMVFCPWCGTKDNAFSKVTRYPLVCPECERGVRAEWTSCPWCYPGRLAGNGRPPRLDPLAERSCSRRGCSGELQPFMRYCPVCKQKPRRVWSHPHLPHRCPRCRWPVSRESWRFCPWCGRRERRAGTFVRTRNGS